MIRNGTLFSRHCSAESEGLVEIALFGFLELPDGFTEHEVHGFVAAGKAGQISLMTTGERYNASADYDLRGDTIDGLLRAQIWPRPNAETGLYGGGLVLRRTLVPAAVGHQIAMLIGAMALPADWLPDAHLHRVSGDFGFGATSSLLIDQSAPCPAQTNGINPSQILKLPIWGWEGEPWGAISTMDIASNRVCEEMETLILQEIEGEIDKAGISRLAELRDKAGWWAPQIGRGDKAYTVFRREMAKRSPGCRWNGALTAGQQASRDRLVREIIDDLDLVPC